MNCDYCHREIPVGRGIMYIKNDGTIYTVCSKRCLVLILRGKRRVQ